jgi:hypothetical protein
VAIQAYDSKGNMAMIENPKWSRLFGNSFIGDSPSPDFMKPQQNNGLKEETRMTSSLVRLSGLVAILGGVLGIVLTPILTYLWATYSDTYGYFGRAYFLVFVGCLLGLAGLYALRRTGMGPRDPSNPSTERWVFVLTFVGLALSLVGDILEYWGGSPEEDFTMLQMQGYSLEGIGLLLVLCGSVAFGLVHRHKNVLPKFVPWLLIAAGPGGLLLSVAHIPSGTMFLFCCAWVVLGYLLLTGKVASAEQPLPVS